MTDIHSIKNILYFLPYLREETWYMLGIGIIIYAIYIAYLMAFERYYREQDSLGNRISHKKTLHEKLDELDIHDSHFFENLSLLVRIHLEESNQILQATKKTLRDIHAESIPQEFKDILEVCTYYEYTGEIAENKEKVQLLQQLKSVI